MSHLAQARWALIGQQPDSAYGGIDWADRANLLRCDPYLVWADVTSSGDVGDRWVPFLVELKTPMSVQKGVELVPTHLHAWGMVRFLPCVLKAKDIRKLFDEVRTQANVLRFEFAGVRAIDPGAEDYRTKHLESQKKRLELNEYRNPLRHADTAVADDRPPPPDQPYQNRRSSERGRRQYRDPKNPSSPLICVIDDRCNFASPRLRAADGARVASVWHQGRSKRRESELSKEKGWTEAFDLEWKVSFPGWLTPIPRGALNGRRLETEGGADEPQAYDATAYLRPMPRWSHGSAVLHALAAGSKSPVPAGRVMFVQLPTTTVNDTAGGALGSQVLEAIHDALDQVSPPGGERQETPIIVNLSFGHHGGPHDGSSMFERALCELLDRHPNLHVVLPAGNSHLLRAHCGGWLSPGRSSVIRWKVLPDNPVDTFLELWCDSPECLEFTIEPPCGPSCSLRCGEAKSWRSGEVVRAAAIFPTQAAQGLHGSMLLLAVSPTRAVLDGGSAEAQADQDRPKRRPSAGVHGVWKVTVRNIGDHAANFHAWAQRGDVAPGREQSSAGNLGRQSFFLDDPEDGNAHPDPRYTLNGIATAHRPGQLWVVGAMRRCDRGLSTYSAAGPNRLECSRSDGPDVVMPVDESLALPGTLSGGVLGSTRIRIGGTSLAAALFSRDLYAHLAKGGTGASFCCWPEQKPTARPRVPAGAPEVADPVFRGEHVRIDPDLMGSLGPQCPPQGKPSSACLDITATAPASRRTGL